MWEKKENEDQSFYHFALEGKKLQMWGHFNFFFPQLDKHQPESWQAAPACTCKARACDSKDTRFLEKAEVYLWRIREGFPTWSEALG
jgi:hypothetical protein